MVLVALSVVYAPVMRAGLVKSARDAVAVAVVLLCAVGTALAKLSWSACKYMPVLYML
jgi:hypothetical protein